MSRLGWRRRLLALAVGLSAVPVQALADSSASRLAIQLGAAHLAPVDRSSRIDTHVVPDSGTLLAGVPEQFGSPGAAINPRAVDTLALTVAYAFSPRWSLQLEVGVPPIVKAEGRGTVSVPTRLGPQLPTDLGDPALKPLGSARAWAPVLELQYWPRGSCRYFCPYIGVGATYAWFTQETLNPAFAEQLNSQYGANLALLAGKPGATTTRVRLSPTLRPAMSLGMTTALAGHWGLTAAVGVTPLTTRADLEFRAADGSLLATTRNRMGANVLLTGLLLRYAW